MAGKVSPVEATRYTEKQNTTKKNRNTRGAKIHQMAFANLGRNKVKTLLVIVSLSLSVVLLNILVTFVSGFNMDRYLAQMTCADFIVSSTNYFRSDVRSETSIAEETVSEISDNVTTSVSGCGYSPSVQPDFRMTEEAYRDLAGRYLSPSQIDLDLNLHARRNDLIGATVLLEGLDDALFEKLSVLEGDLAPLFSPEKHAIAMAVPTDDYGNASIPDSYPAIGESITLTYLDEAYYIDNRTNEPCDENTPEEYLADLTKDDLSELMYESKETARDDFEGFQYMFLLIGGLLYAIIGFGIPSVIYHQTSKQSIIEQLREAE